MAQTVIPSRWARGHAIASRVETGTQGFSAAQASPFTAATPMRSPVKDPGPAATAMAFISPHVSPLFRSISSAMGSSVRLWVRPVACHALASGAPSSSTAQEAALAELSSANSFIDLPPQS